MANTGHYYDLFGGQPNGPSAAFDILLGRGGQASSTIERTSVKIRSPLLAGLAVLFPISSLGHSVILPKLLGWNIHQNDPYFLSFLVATHLATAIVLFVFFWRDWVRILRGLGRSLRDRGIAADDYDAKLGWLLVVGTIPAGLIGLLLEQPLRKLFASAASAAAFLI